MHTAPRSTRRTTAAQLSLGKENQATLCSSPRSDSSNSKPTTTTTTTTSGNKKARHRVSTAELARLEDMFKRSTHPPRQQKKDLAAELGMDYKTVTIWFQNKRQTSKRGQPSPPIPPVVERLVESLQPSSISTRTASVSVAHADAASSLRSVSSPSHNATLDAFEYAIDTTASNAQIQALAPVPTPSSLSPEETEDKGSSVITSPTIVKIRPLLDSLNTLTSRSKDMLVEDRAASLNSDTEDVNLQSPSIRIPQTASENVTGGSMVEVDSNRTIERGRDKDKDKIKSVKWKRIRTLEWACERQAKRRKLSRERFVRSESNEPLDESDSSNDARMDSALSLLSLASTTAQVRPSTDVMRGVLLLLSFKHSWHRK